MPFSSQRQRRWMWKNKPKMAAEWEKETLGKVIPERVRPKPKVTKPRGQRRR